MRISYFYAAIFVFLLGCKQSKEVRVEFPAELVDFVPYKNNPDSSDMKFLGYATSLDGIHWKRYPGNPIHNTSWVEDMQVVKYKGRYYGYYHGNAYKPWRDWSTNVAVSDDLIHWKKYPKNPIIGNNKNSGILVFDGSQYRFYTMVHPAVDLYFPAGKE